MGKSKLFNSLLFSKWLVLRKCFFLVSLQTGMRIYGFLSFVKSILIMDVLLTKLIDQGICEEYRQSTSIQCYETHKQIIVQQLCLAFMSALLIYCLKISPVVTCWLGCKFAIDLLEFSYLLDWTREVFVLIFNINIHLVCFAIIFICFHLYGVLVAISYHIELNGKQASYTFPTNEMEMETNVDIPVPPDLPNF